MLAQESLELNVVFVNCFFRIRLPEDRDKRHGESPFFGLHCVVENEGVVKLGDPVMVS